MSTWTRLLLPGAVALLCCAPLLAQDSGGDLFRANCALCHGADGKSNTPTGRAFKAPDLTSAAVAKMTDAELTRVIHDGKGNMPAFGTRLTDAQIRSLVAHIRSLQKK